MIHANAFHMAVAIEPVAEAIGAHRRSRQPGHQRAAAEVIDLDETRENSSAVVRAAVRLGAASADDYPSKSIRLIVPFAAGGAVGASRAC